ncbi:mitochondrial inner-membrane-bound regulator-domain-containing protein [Dipodascopsis tothii]|uniref:mitochondrial inner-membrane-bound regulator-domain-containing protein n=1 Tax=Dipodascopsis tothii TaxID=44089 RepID=UPI0034CD3F5F
MAARRAAPVRRATGSAWPPADGAAESAAEAAAERPYDSDAGAGGPADGAGDGAAPAGDGAGALAGATVHFRPRRPITGQDEVRVIILDEQHTLRPRRVRTHLESDATTLAEKELEDLSSKLLVFEDASEKFMETIDEMRSARPQVSQKRYEQLAAELYAGFRAKQLRDYARKYEAGGVRSDTTKAAVIEIILRDVWGLAISEQIQARMDVLVTERFELSPKQLALIVGKEGRIPRGWARLGAEITINPAEKAMVVRATAAKIDQIRRSIRGIVDNILDATVDLSFLAATSTTVESVPVQAVSRISDTYVERADDGALRISALGQDKLDVARRLVVSSLGLPLRTANVVAAAADPAADVHCYRVIDNDAVAWQHRQRPWGRYAAVKRRGGGPAAPAAELDTHPLAVFRNNSPRVAGAGHTTAAEAAAGRVAGVASFGDLFGLVQRLSAGFEATRAPSAGPFQPYYSASLGQVLHELGAGPADLAGRLAAPAKANFFSSHVPLLTPFLHKSLAEPSALAPAALAYKMLDGTATNEYRTYVKLRLVPSPYRQPATYMDHPIAEMWFPVTESGETMVKYGTIELIESQVYADVCLPHRPYDVRLGRVVGAMLAPDVPAVQDFLDRLKLDIRENTRVHIPPTLTVAPPDAEPVEYLFESMEHVQEMDYTFGEHTLRYSVVEGGVLRGRRVEGALLCGTLGAPAEFAAFVSTG